MHAQLVEFMSFHDIIKVIIKQKTTEENIFYICACTHMDFWIYYFIFLNFRI